MSVSVAFPLESLHFHKLEGFYWSPCESLTDDSAGNIWKTPREADRVRVFLTKVVAASPRSLGVLQVKDQSHSDHGHARPLRACHWLSGNYT